VEYFLWLRRGASALREEDLERAIAEGPAGKAGAVVAAAREENG
jgi:23S rRNA (cytidine1920-2'-O)/16S rRNA (cytidine1409-2'-O)-methyltransferase